jgi:hypothetical protein
MADPVSISTSLQNLTCQIQAMQFYRQQTNDTTADSWLATLKSTLASNITSTDQPQGYASALAQSVFPGTVY